MSQHQGKAGCSWAPRMTAVTKEQQRHRARACSQPACTLTLERHRPSDSRTWPEMAGRQASNAGPHPTLPSAPASSAMAVNAAPLRDERVVVSCLWLLPPMSPCKRWDPQGS